MGVAAGRDGGRRAGGRRGWGEEEVGRRALASERMWPGTAGSARGRALCDVQGGEVDRQHATRSAGLAFAGAGARLCLMVLHARENAARASLPCLPCGPDMRMPCLISHHSHDKARRGDGQAGGGDAHAGQEVLQDGGHAAARGSERRVGYMLPRMGHKADGRAWGVRQQLSACHTGRGRMGRGQSQELLVPRCAVGTSGAQGKG